VLPDWVVPVEYGLLGAVGLWTWLTSGSFVRGSES
jgi:hypothetical protein